MSLKIVNGILAASVAQAGTFTVAYPDGTNSGTFTGGVRHQMSIGQLVIDSPVKFSLAFGTTNITVTNNTGYTLTQGSAYALQLETLGDDNTGDKAGSFNALRTARLMPKVINLGAPVVAAANGISVSAAVTAASAGAVLALATLDVPRNVVAAWTGNATMTVTGKDEYGNVVVEKSAAATTSLTGKKAFKTITSVTVNADVTACTVGYGDVLGLPVMLPEIGFITRELQDGSAATAGTVVAGVQTAGGSTATTGDVRGSYDPNAACDGSKSFQLFALLADADYPGMPQYAG